MELKTIIETLATSCEGKSGSDGVQVEAALLLAAHKELKDKAQMARDLEMARDEAQGMKPSVARKLNEKIRGLEAELEELRSNKKVKELEKKVHFLEHELKQSYTTKNFTLKSGLLELEKQYRAHMNVDPAMAAFWDDIAALLDEKKERDPAAAPKVPRIAAASLSEGGAARTPRISSTATAPSAQPAAAAAPAAEAEPSTAAAPDSATEAAASTAVVDESAPAAVSAQAAGTSAGDSAGVGAGSTPAVGAAASGVQHQVETFNTIITEEAASAAASMPADAGISSHTKEAGEVVVRHGAGFRVVRPGGVAAGAAAAEGSVVAEEQQPVQALREDFASKWHDVSFHALPSILGFTQAGDDAAAAAAQPVAARALEQQADAITCSLQSLLGRFSTLAADGSVLLPVPPLLEPSAVSSSGSVQLSGEVDAASLWQQQLQQLLEKAQHLKQQAAADEPGKSAEGQPLLLQQQQEDTAALMATIKQLRAALQEGSNSSEGQAAAAVNSHLAELQQELQQLQHLQQKASREANSQELLLAVFGEFLSQLQQQGALSAAAAASQQQPQQPPVLLDLLQSFLQVNPQVPQLLAATLVPAAATASAQTAAADEAAGLVEGSSSSRSTTPVNVSSSAVQAVADLTHREAQCDPLPEPQHASTQSEEPPAAPQSHAETQYEPGSPHCSDAGVQAEAPGPVLSHVSIQAGTESVSAATQASPPDSPVSAGVQAELRPEVSHVGSQADLGAHADPGVDPGDDVISQDDESPGPSSPQQQPAAPAPATIQQPEPAAAVAAAAAAAPTSQLISSRPPLSPRDPQVIEKLKRTGSGIIYGGSGAELSLGKVAVGQQLDILHQLQQRSRGEGEGEGGSHTGGATALVDVKADDLKDLDAAAKEMSQLRADNLELAASLQVTKSLVEHLNTNLKGAIDKADDAEAEAVQVRQQLEVTAQKLAQLQAEHAEVTHVLIDAKVEIAEKKGELLKLVRDLRRAIANPRTSNAAVVVKELEDILAVVPSVDDDGATSSPRNMDTPHSPGGDLLRSRLGSMDLSRTAGLSGIAAGLGHMREAWAGSRARGRTSDSFSTPVKAAAGADAREADSGAAAEGNSSTVVT